MKTVGIIPARYGSTRLEAKVLADIAGKPMIRHVWERASQSRLLDELVIACDDERILKKAESFGAKALLTAKTHASGSDRIAEAVGIMKLASDDIVVNIQGDEPMIDASVIDALAQALADDEACSMATVVKVIDNPQDIQNPNIVKAVLDNNGYALYFSRAAIPCDRERKQKVTYYKHLGLYAYRKDFLLTFTKMPKSPLEEAEQLEQLRVLEAGYKIKTVETDVETIAVDTQEDLRRVAALLK
jgi:3-deoxy-manno-octulosonate cytidylyltransferase (CMP-KDO synthetase)